MNSVTLYLKKPELEDYLRFVFNAGTRGPIEISRHKDIGRYLYSQLRFSPLPVAEKQILGLTRVTLNIPMQQRAKTTEYNFLYFNLEDMDRINDFLIVDFNMFFKGFMLAGEEMKIEQKDLIESFMVGTGIRDVGKKFDTLKKKDYRHRKKIFKIMVESLYKIGFQTDKNNNQCLSLCEGTINT